jgi:hypothetical protein
MVTLQMIVHLHHKMDVQLAIQALLVVCVTPNAILVLKQTRIAITIIIITAAITTTTTITAAITTTAATTIIITAATTTTTIAVAVAAVAFFK